METSFHLPNVYCHFANVYGCIFFFLQRFQLNKSAHSGKNLQSFCRPIWGCTRSNIYHHFSKYLCSRKCLALRVKITIQSHQSIWISKKFKKNDLKTAKLYPVNWNWVQLRDHWCGPVIHGRFLHRWWGISSPKWPFHWRFPPSDACLNLFIGFFIIFFWVWFDFPFIYLFRLIQSVGFMSTEIYLESATADCSQFYQIEINATNGNWSNLELSTFWFQIRWK